MKSKASILLALWFLMFVHYLDRATIGVAGPAIMQALHMTPAAFGVVLSSFGIGYILTQVPGGMLADRWGAKLLLVLGPISWALFTGATGLVTAVIGLVTVRIGFGVAEGLSTSATLKAVGDNFDPKDRAQAIGTYMTAMAVGPALAGPLVGWLVSAAGWRTMFVIMMAPASLAALLNLLLLPSSPPASKPEDVHAPEDVAPPIHNMLGRPSLWLLCLGQFGANTANWGYLSWMPSYLALSRHIELKSVGVLAGIPYVFAFLGLLIGGRLGSTTLHRHRPVQVVCFYLMAGLSLFFAYQAATLSLALAGLSSTAFFMFGSLSPVSSITLDLAPAHRRGTYVGIYYTAIQMASVIAPAVIGFLVSSTGSFAAGFGYMIGALLLGGACMFALMPFLKPNTLEAVRPPYEPRSEAGGV